MEVSVSKTSITQREKATSRDAARRTTIEPGRKFRHVQDTSCHPHRHGSFHRGGHGCPAEEPLDTATLNTIKSQFVKLMELANAHDFKALHGMFWQSPSTLLVAKSTIPCEGNWAGFWGNKAVDQKLHDIGSSGPVVLEPDYSRLKVVGLTRDVAESYVPMNITVSYAGQDGTAKPFLMIIDWLRIGEDWKIASEIILPVPPVPATKG
jgi:hypothetical protein